MLEIGDTAQFGTKASPLTQAPFSADSYVKKNPSNLNNRQ